MRILLFEHLRTAKESLRRTRMRTLLTILGIAIGIGSITAILALGQGLTHLVSHQADLAGEKIAVVRPSMKTTSILDFANPMPPHTYSTSPLTERDMTELEKIEGIDTIVPLMTISGSVRSSQANPAISSILATTPDFVETTDMPMRDGQFFDESSSNDTAVIGRELSLDLFGTDDTVGKVFTIQGQRFTVIGVLKQQNNPINYNNVNFNHAAIVSFASGKLFNRGVAQIQQLNIKTADETSAAALKSDIAKLLKANHNDEADTIVLTGAEVAAPANRLLQLISAVMTAVAAISLVVGGIGIMNIMLVGVSERTREIGLRKAVGASSVSIVTQFMVESILLSLAGGLLGFIAGYTLAFVVSLFLPYDPVLSWYIVALAGGLAVGVGTLFGVYPAYKAAQKHPIESLRRLH